MIEVAVILSGGHRGGDSGLESRARAHGHR
jgi:hypothetical protein